jgi:hypothetical protein
MKNTLYKILVASTLIITGCVSPQDKPTERAISWDSNKQDFIDVFLKSGGEIEAEYKKAYIMPGFWNAMDHNQKADAVCVMAQYCQRKKYDGVVWINVYDKMTGKKLANWSNNSGLTIE